DASSERPAKLLHPATIDQGAPAGSGLMQPRILIHETNMKTGFTPIRLEDYVELHLRANPETKRAEVIARLEYAIDAYQRDIRCHCGAPIWIIGSAEAGLACFTC